MWCSKSRVYLLVFPLVLCSLPCACLAAKNLKQLRVRISQGVFKSVRSVLTCRFQHCLRPVTGFGSLLSALRMLPLQCPLFGMQLCENWAPLLTLAK
jgi:hypothetical protein